MVRRTGGQWLVPAAEGDSPPAAGAAGGDLDLRPIPLSAAERDYGLDGFSARALRPLCHYALDRCSFEERDWRHYQRVNRRAADQLAGELGPRDVTWIDDYPFMLLPELLRQRLAVCGPVVAFLHPPFPAEDVLKAFPWRAEVVRGLLGADLVGFTDPSFAGHFLGCCRRLLGAEVDHRRGWVNWHGRRVRVGAYPVGIDAARVESAAGTPRLRAHALALRRLMGAEKLVLGIDRLDPSKGLLQRLDAVETLLASYPQLHDRVVFLQVVGPPPLPTPELEVLRERIEERVGRINGRFGEAGWVPVHYVYRELGPEERLAHLSAADVVLVTPLRDGASLTAEEYCAVHADERGVLVLSELSAAARALGGEAMLVNPFDTELTGHRLYRALTMPRREVRRRMALLRHQVAADDPAGWAAQILTAALRRSWAAEA